ncbi:hypothetical protein NC653_011081 [Populus alba x Populus x berolinensis]|uniref:Secreted protein n=1 Tax=Populus alba x Populus x berolinensis TaxID=444605 RepID=A0AAD6R146_9ROSI|nr:hypothetical protein NC653_011081 [Populus alba x Populus x berolinensis]
MPLSLSLAFSSSGVFGVLSLCSGERGNWNPLAGVQKEGQQSLWLASWGSLQASVDLLSFLLPVEPV